ncbi:MAG: glycosyltransferase [Acidobacteriota bacterium]
MPLRVAFLVKSLPMMSWVADQVVGLESRGLEVSPLAMQMEPGAGSGPAIGPGGARARLLGLPAGPGRKAGAVMAEAAGALAQDPRAACPALGRIRRRTGAFRTVLGFAALRRRAQLLHAHFGNYAASVLPVKRLTGLPFIVSFYGWDASAAPLRDPGMYQDLFAESRAVIALSEEMRQTLEGLGCPAGKIEIVHISVQGRKLREEASAARQEGGGGEDPASGLHLLAVARLVEKKGLDDALDALALVARRQIPFRFRIAGDGPLRSELESQAAVLGLRDRVEFLGALSRKAVFAEMGRTDLFFLPSRRAASGDREGTPTVLIEAGALGLPCVATLHAGTPEVVLHGETGLLAAERDVPALAEAVIRLARDRELRRRMGAAAMRHIEAGFELESQCARLESIYRRCLGPAKAA